MFTHDDFHRSNCGVPNNEGKKQIRCTELYIRMPAGRQANKQQYRQQILVRDTEVIIKKTFLNFCLAEMACARRASTSLRIT